MRWEYVIFCGLENVHVFVCDQRQIQSGLVFFYDHRIVLSDGDFLWNCLCSVGEHQGPAVSANSQISEAAFPFSAFWSVTNWSHFSTCTLPSLGALLHHLGDSFYLSPMLDPLFHVSLLFLFWLILFLWEEHVFQ